MEPTNDRAVANRASDYLGVNRGAVTPIGVGIRLLNERLRASRNQMLVPGWAEAPRLSVRPLEGLWLPVERLPYIHVYDCNSAYLSAARNSMFPCGVPTLRALAPESPLPPALVVRLSDIGGTDDPLLVPAKAAGWYSVDVFDQIVSAHGTATAGTPAWFFPERHKALTTWAERIWTGRLAARADNAHEAEAFIKNIAVRTIGYMGRMPKDGEQAHWWYQPQWRAVIVAQHCGKMARMVRRWRILGATVLGVHDDAIAISSKEPDIYTACPEPDQIGAGLGRLKCVQSLNNGKQVAAHAAMATLSPQRWFRSLDGSSNGE